MTLSVERVSQLWERGQVSPFSSPVSTALLSRLTVATGSPPSATSPGIVFQPAREAALRAWSPRPSCACSHPSQVAGPCLSRVESLLSFPPSALT